MNGWVILDKPLGLGSTQAVAAVKRVCREAGLGKVKVGHGGTLDPLATGVLPIALGEATKLTGRMLDASKTYDFTISFGTETDGLDAEGAVVATSDVRPTLGEVVAVLPRFTGAIEQIPPAFSAIKVDGQRAYARARAGEVVEMVARTATVHALSPLPFRGGDGGGAVGTVSRVGSPHPNPASIIGPSGGRSRLLTPVGEGPANYPNNRPKKLRSDSTSCAQLWPGAPVTPPPGCDPAPHMYRPPTGPR